MLVALQSKLSRHSVTIFSLFGMLLILLLVWQPTSNADFWILRATGEWIVRNGAIPHHFPFAFTAGETVWIEHKWLFDLIIYYITTLPLFGSWGPLFLKIVLSVGTVAVAYRWLLPKTPLANRLLGIALLVFLVAAMPGRFNERSHVAGDLCLVIMLAMLLNIRVWRWPQLLSLALLQIFWVNLHGSFILAVIIVGIDSAIASVTHRDHRAWIRLAIVTLASCVSPYGIKAFLSPLTHFFSTTSSPFKLAEWQPVNWLTAEWQMQLLGIVFASLSLLFIWQSIRSFRQTRRLDWRLLGFWLALTWLASSSLRFVSSAGFVLLPFLSARVPSIQKRWQTLVSVLAILLMLTATLPTIRNNLKQPPWQIVASGMPVAATTYLQENKINGNLFNSSDYGGYLAGRLYPHMLIYLDGRLDVYPPQVVNDYFTSLKNDGAWEQLVKQYNITAILLGYRNDRTLAQPFLQRRLDSKSWALVYLEENGALLLRRDVREFTTLIKRDEYKFLRPTDDLHYLNSATTPEKQFQQQLDEINRLQKNQPTFVLPWLMLARARESHRNPVVRAQACSAYEEAIRQLQTVEAKIDPLLQFSLATCYGERNDLAMAMNLFKELSTIPSMREKSLLNWGLCHAKLGTFNEAEKIWQTLLKEYPDNVPVKQLLELLRNRRSS